jgi:hypothetical protein
MNIPLQQPNDPSAYRPQPGRDGVDHWRTPACMIRALTRFVLPVASDAGRLSIWEPGAGEGAIADALDGEGWPVVATDLAPRRADIGRLDFLHEAPPPATRDAVLCTNPPFRDPLLNQFIVRGLALLDQGSLQRAVLLLRIDHLAAAGRVAVFNRAAAIWICCWRPRWILGSTGNGRWSFAWVRWNRDNSGPPVTRFLTADLDQRSLPL